jgi:hypothetical protein
MRQLLYTWEVGGARYVHAGYGVCETGSHNSPKRVVSRYELAEKAVDVAEELGPGHAAFRLVESLLGIEAREMIQREDLPVSEGLNPGS